MKNYIVKIKEVHNSYVMVKANNGEEALKAVEEGNGEEFDLQYDYTLDPETWSIEDYFDDEEFDNDTCE